MRAYSTVLKLGSLVFFAVAALHLVLGPRADQMLGAVLSPQALADPSLDSQNRFYGVAFAFYGVALFTCATDVPRFKPVLVGALVVFFLAGCSRLISWAMAGAPAPPVIGLLVVELVVPVLLGAWLQKVLPRGLPA